MTGALDPEGGDDLLPVLKHPGLVPALGELVRPPAEPQGRLEVVRIGRSVRVPAASLERFVERLRSEDSS